MRCLFLSSDFQLRNGDVKENENKIVRSSKNFLPFYIIALHHSFTLHHLFTSQLDTRVHSSRKILFIRSIQRRYTFQREIKNIIRITRHD